MEWGDGELRSDITMRQGRYGVELMFLLDNVSRIAANDVVREEQSLHETEVTLLKP